MEDERPEQRRVNPIFRRIVEHEKQQPTGAVDAVVERRVNQARAEGYFDNLAGHGKPIPDIDHHRQPGWWADRFVAQERKKLKAVRAEERVRKAMPALWRLPSEREVIERVHELNATLDLPKRLDPDATLQTWRRLQN